LLFVQSLLYAQVENGGMPYSWGNNNVQSTIWYNVPAVDNDALVAASQSELRMKEIPYRFADTISVSFTLENAGRWYNLSDGDRLWRLALKSENATSMGLEFSQFQLPPGANLYMYNEGNTEFSGPYTQSINAGRSALSTIPIPGDNIIVEYFEPAEQRGEGQLSIQSVVAGFRTLTNMPEGIDISCFSLLNPDEARSLENAQKSIVLMVVDHGQRLASGTLINNTRGDGTTMVLTSASALVGSPSSWLFVFDQSDSNCGGGLNCWNRALVGATILAIDENSGLALLALKQHPKNSWGVYYSGWSSSPTIDLGICLQKALGLSNTISVSESELVSSTFNQIPTVAASAWSEGATYPGSLGSPLFNANGELEAVFVGGDLSCNGIGEDHFSKLRNAWSSFSPFLSPTNSGFSALQGFYPIFNESGDDASEESTLILFPNPTSGNVTLSNKSTDDIVAVSVYDQTGRVVHVQGPNFGRLSLQGLANGLCVVRVMFKSGNSSSHLLVLESY
jgi:hypothetical protein